MRSLGVTLLAAGAYFGLVFLLGFTLGTLRTILVAPRLGEGLAVAAELPLMLAASWIVCGWLIRRLRVPGKLPERLAMGAVALVLLMAAELGISTWFFGRSPADHFGLYGNAPQLLGLAAQIAFALFPAVHMSLFTPEPAAPRDR